MKRFLGCLTIFLGLTTTLFHLLSFFNGKWERRNWFWKEENIYFSIENIDEDYWRLYINRVNKFSDSDYIEFAHKLSDMPPTFMLHFPITNPDIIYLEDCNHTVELIKSNHLNIIYVGRFDSHTPRSHIDSIFNEISFKTIGLNAHLKSISYWNEQGKWQRNISEIE